MASAWPVLAWTSAWCGSVWLRLGSARLGVVRVRFDSALLVLCWRVAGGWWLVVVSRLWLVVALVVAWPPSRSQ